MAQVVYNPKFQALDDTGAPLAGGKLYTYASGTSTPKTTWADAGEVTPNANPVVLDSRGEATLYGNGSYKFILKTSSDVTVWTVDSIAIGGTVVTADIADLAVTTAKLAANVLSADSTGRGKMQDGFVTSAKLDTSGVTLPDGSAATTKTTGNNTTAVATTAFVQQEITAGKKVRKVSTTVVTATQSVSASIPADGTIPQNTEGTEVFSVAFTPVAADSIIVVEAMMYATSANNITVAAMFKDSGADAVVGNIVGSADFNSPPPVPLVYKETSGSTSSRTYKVRVGASAGGYNVYVNRGPAAASPLGSGIIASTLIITEYAP